MSLRVSYDDVEHKGTDSGGGLVLYYQGQPLNGIVEEVVNGILIGEAEFTDGHRGGIQRDYYPNGQIKEEFTIRFNKVEGVFTEWDENGKITSQTTWQNGVQVS
jgi:antitoxin component YwqK of YwqJK toxin-antitoxin module